MLQLEFLSAGSQDCPLLRISGDDPASCATLIAGVARLSQGQIDRLAIDELPGMAPVDGCRLSAVEGDWDRGVIKKDNAGLFEWILTRHAWDNVIGLIEPFCESGSPGRYQWLESAGDIRVLITSSGAW